MSEPLDPTMTMLDARVWVSDALSDNGAEITGSGMGLGGADVQFTYNGINYNLNLQFLP